MSTINETAAQWQSRIAWEADCKARDRGNFVSSVNTLIVIVAVAIVVAFLLG